MTTAKFKPMLAEPADFSILRFPLFASPKLDGIRATIHEDGVAYSRSMKPLPNRWLQHWVESRPEMVGLDGEFVVGSPAAPNVFSQTTSWVMSIEKRDFQLCFHVFDMHDMGDTPYAARLRRLTMMAGPWKLGGPLVLLEQRRIEALDELDAFETEALSVGYEGVMTRDPRGVYKQGRSTAHGQELLKVKRTADLEAVVIGFEELMHNGNEAFRNELGRTARSSAAAGKKGLGTLGALTVRGLPGSPFADVEFSVGGGFDMAARASLWTMRAKLAGKIIRVKHFPIGAVDRPRYPIFAGFRDARDIG